MAHHGIFVIAASLLCVIVAANGFEGYFSSSSMEGLTIEAQALYSDTTMDLFAMQRLLQDNNGHVSYDTLRSDFAPCMEGQPYMSNCQNNPTIVNPYKMDCTQYNRCKRYTQ